jgi:hypothetical protein
VDKSTKRDGKNDCIDGSDENLPECKQNSINNTQHINGSIKCLYVGFKLHYTICYDITHLIYYHSIIHEIEYYVLH